MWNCARYTNDVTPSELAPWDIRCGLSRRRQVECMRSTRTLRYDLQKELESELDRHRRNLITGNQRKKADVTFLKISKTLTGSNQTRQGNVYYSTFQAAVNESPAPPPRLKWPSSIPPRLRRRNKSTGQAAPSRQSGSKSSRDNGDGHARDIYSLSVSPLLTPAQGRNGPTIHLQRGAERVNHWSRRAEYMYSSKGSWSLPRIDRQESNGVCILCELEKRRNHRSPPPPPHGSENGECDNGEGWEDDQGDDDGGVCAGSSGGGDLNVSGVSHSGDSGDGGHSDKKFKSEKLRDADIREMICSQTESDDNPSQSFLNRDESVFDGQMEHGEIETCSDDIVRAADKEGVVKLIVTDAKVAD